MNNAIIHFFDEAGIDAVANDYLLSNYEILDTSEKAVYEHMISSKYGSSKNICLMGTANNDRVEYVSTFIFLNGMTVDGSTLAGMTQMIMIPAVLFDDKYSNLENLRNLMTDLIQSGTRDQEGTTATLTVNSIEYSLTITNAMIGFAVNTRDENSTPAITDDTIHTHVFGNWENSDSSSHTRICTCSEKEIEAHVFDSGKITTEPTYTSNGVKTYTCTKCGATRTEMLPILDPPPTPEILNYDHPCICSYCNHDDGTIPLTLHKGTETDVKWLCSSCGQENGSHITYTG